MVMTLWLPFGGALLIRVESADQVARSPIKGPAFVLSRLKPAAETASLGVPVGMKILAGLATTIGAVRP